MLVDHAGRPLTMQRDTDVAQIQRILAKELGSRSAAGRPFTANVWIYSIVTAIASSLGDIPFGLWRPATGAKAGKFSTKTWVPVENHPLDERIRRPNPWQDRRRFIEQWVTFLLLGGNVWMYIDDPQSTDVPRALFLFGVDTVAPVRARPNVPPTAWQISRPGEGPIVIPLERMIHWALPNDIDQWIGIPPWLSMDTQIDADHARVVFDRAFFRNNATPDLVITHKPGPISRPTRELIEEAWYESYGGEERHGGVAVVGGDLDVKVLGIGHAQAEYISSRKFTRQEAAACYAYPVQLLNDIEGGGLGRDQLSVARTMKYENAVFPQANRFAERFTEELLISHLKLKNIMAAFNFDPLPVMIDFLATKTDILTKLVTSGVPLNAALAMLDMGLDPVEGGDYPYIPSNLVPLQSTPPEPQPVVAPAAPGEKLPAPAPKSKPPAKKAGVDLPSLDVRRNVWRAIDPLAYRAIKSVKRIYIDAQHEAFKHLHDEIPFNVVLSAERWMQRLEPFLMGAFIIGTEHGDGRQAWTEETDDLDGVITYLQYSTAQYPDAALCVRELNDESADVLRNVYTQWSRMTGRDRERIIQRDIADQAAFGIVTDAIVQAMIGAYNRGVAWAKPAGEAPTVLRITYHQAEATP